MAEHVGRFLRCLLPNLDPKLAPAHASEPLETQNKAPMIQEPEENPIIKCYFYLPTPIFSPLLSWGWPEWDKITEWRAGQNMAKAQQS